VICPLEIIKGFLAAAARNTNTKIETCAILGGIEQGGQFIINTLIVPSQTGKDDQCSMTDEMELFEVQIAQSIITIGWIHTHPQYDVFLSSIDLHNQLGY
jgi:STAM-binding protein